MEKLRTNILDISNNHYKYLMNLENVMGLGFGHKHINGINTSEPCIHVLVETKIKKDFITSNNLIPKNYMGIKTDVIEIGKIRTTSGEQIPEKYRPLIGGCAIGLSDFNTSGTLGCFVKRVTNNNTEFFILSNNHVLAYDNKAPIGTPVIQPSKDLGGNPNTDIIATLSNFMPLRFVRGNKEPVNRMDAAIAKVVNVSRLATKALLKLKGILKPATKANVGDTIIKVGHVTGLTQGTVNTVDATIGFPFGNNGIAIFINQILGDLPNASGDSGSIVVNQNNAVVGLFFAGNTAGTSGIMNDISEVLQGLNVQLCV